MVSREPWRSAWWVTPRDEVGAGLAALLIGLLVAATLPLFPSHGHAQAAVPFEDIPIQSAGVNGPVFASELVGNELWIGGGFTTARDFAPGSPDVATSRLAVIDINTGALLSHTFDFNGDVMSIEFHEDIVWVVGEFTTLDGAPAGYVVAFDALTGERLDTFTGYANDELRDVAYHDGWLYLVGNPSFFNGIEVGTVLRVDPATGTLDTSWTPAVSRYVEGVDAFGDLVAVAERSNASGSETKLLSTVTGLKVDGLDAASRITSGMWDAKFSPDGAHVYLAETGNSISKYTVADQLLWVTDRAGGDMQAVVATDDVVFGGFHESWFGDEDRKLVAFDAATGAEEASWYVQMDGYWGVWDLEIFDQGLIAAGEFTWANGVNARRIAIFRPTGAWVEAEALEGEEEVLAGDVNCDELVDVTDALYLVQYSVDNRTPVINCDSLDPVVGIYAEAGDVDGDGDAGVIDAMLIAQCSVGNPNVFCPDE